MESWDFDNHDGTVTSINEEMMAIAQQIVFNLADGWPERELVELRRRYRELKAQRTRPRVPNS